MTYDITFEANPTYIHATITGINSRETVPRYQDNIAQECARRDCNRVLVEERREGKRLDAMELFGLVSEGRMKALGQFEAIAYIDQKMGEMAEFAETIAVNRGMPMSVFDCVDDAKVWLARPKPATPGQANFFSREK